MTHPIGYCLALLQSPSVARGPRPIQSLFCSFSSSGLSVQCVAAGEKGEATVPVTTSMTLAAELIRVLTKEKGALGGE